MENSSDVDLEQRISQWRESLSNRPSLRGEDVEELESHLRDSVNHLSESGLSDEEAFLVAARRAGSPSELERQYEAVNPASIWKARALWMITGVLLYWILGSMNGILSAVSMFTGFYFSLDTDIAAWGGVAIQSIFFVGFVAALVIAAKRSGVLPHRLFVSIGALLVIVPLLKIGQIGMSVMATRFLPIEAVGAQALAGVWWTLAQTIGIIGIGIVLLRSQSSGAEQLE